MDEALNPLSHPGHSSLTTKELILLKKRAQARGNQRETQSVDLELAIRQTKARAK